MGGTDVTKMSIKAMSQPPGISRQVLDTVASHRKKASEYSTERMMNVQPMRMTSITMARYSGESFQNVAIKFWLHLRYVSHWVRAQSRASEDICRDDRETLPDRRWFASLLERDHCCGWGNRVSEEERGGVVGDEELEETLSLLAS